ncbi:flp pilus-assembly TadE/G-like family protein [Nocardia farcinica]|uniref:Rv3654c family TadE-like protein n=1 Tax=Nocardia farcinica TaxID=37329 RepID=UPI0018933484|nr:Rv3654c family TadE-like protein [Nocardia farcinica]MBF6139028.1 flp pilus-assembly TadE/G-like family protein [Nocardia farcinica]MBF6260039.1 flp pilus-assembly TadE/G-like family protein [Nocardia farcinica]
MPGRGGEEGGATVFACVALVGLIAVTLLIAQVGTVVVARHRVQAAADLGALAGAGALQAGADEACAAAEAVVRRMGALVSECEVMRWDVTVSVERIVRMGAVGARTVRASARAGPAEQED